MLPPVEFGDQRVDPPFIVANLVWSGCMRRRRLKITEPGVDAVYHCMTRTVNGEHLFEDRDKERLRRMLWQVADFSGVEILTYCLMNNHFHVLVYVPYQAEVSDRELLRRYRVLYPKPTAYETASIEILEKTLAEGGREAEALRRKLLARMGDVSQFMKTLKQRFSLWLIITMSALAPSGPSGLSRCWSRARVTRCKPWPLTLT